MGFFRLSWRPSVLPAAIVLTALMMGAPRLAQAQSVAITQTGITRVAPLRTDPTGRYKVSRSDCLLNDIITFPLLVGNYANSTLEVWATQATSDDCRSDTARTTATATCWRVYRTVPNNITLEVPIRVQDFAARPPTSEGQGVGGPEGCNSSTSTAQPVTLWFMFLQGTTQVGTAQSWNTTVDLLGPSPPTVDPMGPPGGGLLKLSWKTNADPDVFTYKFFCEDLGATDVITTYEAGAPGPEGGGGGGGGQICPDAGSGGASDAGDPTDDAGDDSGAGGGTAGDAGCTPGTGGSGGSGGSGGGSGTSGCGSALVEGQILTPEQIEKYACGSSSKTSSTALITGLKNFNKYAVAVTAADIVENNGGLSIVQCGTPEPVNGFDEVYRSAGGKAGGASFCSVGLRSAAARAKLWPGAGFVAAVALYGWRRRRQGVSLPAVRV